MKSALLVLSLALASASGAQEAPAPAPSPSGVALPELTQAALPAQAAPLRYGNRTIVVMRGTLVGRLPASRAAAAVKRLDELAEQGHSDPVATRNVGGLTVLTVAGHEAFAILPTDADPEGIGDLAAVASEAQRNLALAMAEVVEGQSPARLLVAALRSLGMTALALLLAFTLAWTRSRATARSAAWLRARLVRPEGQQGSAEFWGWAEVRLVALVHVLFRLVLLALALLLGYLWFAFVLRQFPYTRPWGEALRGFVIATVTRLGGGFLSALPGLFTVLLIVFVTRAAGRIVGALFTAVEEGRMSLPGIYAETAPPTRRIVVALLWVFAIVVAYPYLPGSGSEAFKGVSVFLGLMISLGSSGLVNQAMSSFMIMYSRALRPGDFVRIGDVEGVVVQTGVLATKVATRRNEEITLPNAVVASSTITNYTRRAHAGVMARTAVTIGYDTPWRQVEALLLEAASRTPGLRSEPAPRVLQTALADFFVEYTLLVAPERPEERVLVLSALHGHIQDAFNEHGVQIMSPHYEADPQGPKLVHRDDWYAAPAKPAPKETPGG